MPSATASTDRENFSRMNIVIKRGEGGIYCRPDTTLERENRDFYCPDEMGGLSYSPVIFARISKTGKWISSKFVDRYYDSVGFGIMIYDSSLLDGSIDSIASASCYDHSSLLPQETVNKDDLINGGVQIFKNTDSIYRTITEEMAERLEKAICEVSAKVSLRIGDIVALELTSIAHLADKDETKLSLKILFNEKTLLESNVIM